MSATSHTTLKALAERVNIHLQSLTNPKNVPAGSQQAPAGLSDANTYVVKNGGKRVRPALVYLAAHAISPGILENQALQAVDYAACAIELLHTYSLVHDDLPAMDDDDLRRGRPSCHIAFDEATAILVGDALQARAFELLTQAPGVEASIKVAQIAALAEAAGSIGMVGGQFVDIKATDSALNLSQLKAMHEAKTGAIIQAALSLGARVSNGSIEQVAALQAFGKHIGLAFQVVDDVLDVDGSSDALGKTSGKDSAANKPTYVSLLGLEQARKEAQDLLAAAIAEIEIFGEAAEPLRTLGRFVVERDR